MKMKLKWCWCFLLIIGISVRLSAQTYDESIRFGDVAFSEGDFYAASTYYKNAWTLDSSRLNLAYKLAETNRLFNNYKVAEYWYSLVNTKDDSTKFPLSLFWLAVMNKNNANYQNAEKNFQKYTSIHSAEDIYYTKKASHEVEVCSHIGQLLKDSAYVRVEHLGQNVNTPYSEFAAVKLGDSLLLFSSLRPLTEPAEGSEPLIPNACLSKLFRSNSTIAGWTKGKELSAVLNKNEKNTANTSFTADHKKYFFSRCNSDKIAKPMCEIFAAEYKDGKWLNVEKLPERINLPGYTATQPTIGLDENNEQVLYFVSDRPGGYGNMDIWYSVIKNGTYNEPANLGNIINTPGDEITPFYYSTKGTLYFSSDWHAGLGGFDIFKSKGGMSQWTKPVNVGYPLNTSVNDIYYTVNEVDSDGYFTSNRPGSYFIKGETCCNDIYAYEWTGKKQVIKKKEHVIVPDTIKIEDWVKALLPLTLYFHNDIPDPGSALITTKLNYKSTLAEYVQMRDIYKKEYAKGLNGAAKEKAEKDIDEFFDDYIVKGFAKLERFSDWLLQDLKRGSVVKITVKGYCSPLHTTEYNQKLAKRRISSLVNYFREYNDGVFIPYLDSTSKDHGKLQIYEDAIGKLQANPFVSDNPNDERNSVYSRAAAMERKIQIIFYNSDNAGTANQSASFPLLTIDSDAYDFGDVLQGEKKTYYLSYQNTGKTDLILTSVESDCSCITAQWSTNALVPGAKAEIEISFDPKSENGFIKPSITITSNAQKTKTSFSFTANVKKDK